jgi:peptide-methionine (S)-S-oxide reductase
MRARLIPALAAVAFALASAAAAEDQVQGPPAPAAAGQTAVATFAGGCFWCMQPPFDRTPGVLRTTAGYTGGSKVNPTYHEVSDGGTGHAESVEITYDPSKVSYQQLLDIYWHNVDPLDAGGQFCDRGNQYRTAIFYHGDEQKREAEASKQALLDSKHFEQPVVTEVVPAGPFYPAEDYHQEYYKKNPIRYKFYRWNCGRDQRLAELWGAVPTH